MSIAVVMSKRLELDLERSVVVVRDVTIRLGIGC